MRWLSGGQRAADPAWGSGPQTSTLHPPFPQAAFPFWVWPPAPAGIIRRRKGLALLVSPPHPHLWVRFLKVGKEIKEAVGWASEKSPPFLTEPLRLPEDVQVCSPGRELGPGEGIPQGETASRSKRLSFPSEPSP